MFSRCRLRAAVYAPLFIHLSLRKCVFEPEFMKPVLMKPVLMKPALLNLLLPKRVRILVTIPDDSLHERMSRAMRKAHVVESTALWKVLRCRKHRIVESLA